MSREFPAPESPSETEPPASPPRARSSSDAAVWIDGVRVEPTEARVSVFDRGFLYGDSVFETLRTYNRKAFALKAHIDRLARSARLVHIELNIGREQLRAEVETALAEVDYPESYVRLMLTRGQGALGLDPGTALSPLRVMIVAPLVPLPPEAYTLGANVITYKTQRPGDATAAAGAKIGNYLVAVLAMRKAREMNATEALIVDHAGNVVEGATSNVFLVQDGAVYTPSEEDGILPGITRRTILSVAASLGVVVHLGPLKVSRLRAADEVFVSSSIREILPVVRIDGRDVGQGVPGPVTLRLLEAFRNRVRAGSS